MRKDYILYYTGFCPSVIRACPECRVKSDFVTPSRYWVEEKNDKKKLIEEYKMALRFVIILPVQNVELYTLLPCLMLLLVYAKLLLCTVLYCTTHSLLYYSKITSAALLYCIHHY